MLCTTGFQPAIKNRAEKYEEKITRQKPDIIGQGEQTSEQCARRYLIVEDIVSYQAKNREKIGLECDVRHTLQFEPYPEIAGYEYEAIYANYRDGLNKETYEVFYTVSWRFIPWQNSIVAGVYQHYQKHTDHTKKLNITLAHLCLSCAALFIMRRG